MTQKNFSDIRNQEQILTELRVVRAGATLYYAAQVKQDGNKLEAQMNSAKSSFNRMKTEKDDGKKMDHMAAGFSALCDAMIQQRKMLGNITGLALSAALISERSNKEITKLMSGGKRR